MQKLGRKSIVSKTVQLGFWTAVSRLFGLVRTLLTARYLGADALSDAFLTAFKIPNLFRKTFAEGALTAAFLPTFITLIRRKEKAAAQGLMSISFLVFEAIVLALCLLIFVNARTVVFLIAPGFSLEQIELTIPLLRILIFFIFFISSSALLAAGLQAAHHFFIPAFAPVALNVFIIASLGICLVFHLPAQYLCYGILAGGLFQLLMHLYMYFKLNFKFGRISLGVFKEFKHVLWKFLPSLFSISIMEINLFIDTMFASGLPKGSLTLIDYGARFMQIPLGIFGVAFSTILLPHFARISTYAPRRLGFYLLEATKLVTLVTVPVTLFMCLFANNIFLTFSMFVPSLTVAQVTQARLIFVAFTAGLFFFSLNKILFNIYSAYHDTLTPTIISVVATLFNIGFNWLLKAKLQAPGLALATTISGLLQCILFIWFLHRKFAIALYGKNFLIFCMRFFTAFASIVVVFFSIYKSVLFLLKLLPEGLQKFFMGPLGFWVWVGPLACLLFLLLLLMRKKFKLRLHFLG